MSSKSTMKAKGKSTTTNTSTEAPTHVLKEHFSNTMAVSPKVAVIFSKQILPELLSMTPEKPADIDIAATIRGFHKLSTELRLKIWECFDDLHDTEVEIHFRERAADDTYAGSGTGDYFKPKFTARLVSAVPTILHICTESRDVGLKRYHDCFGLDDEVDGIIYMNPDTDTLVLRFRPLIDKTYDENGGLKKTWARLMRLFGWVSLCHEYPESTDTGPWVDTIPRVVHGYARSKNVSAYGSSWPGRAGEVFLIIKGFEESDWWEGDDGVPLPHSEGVEPFMEERGNILRWDSVWKELLS